MYLSEANLPASSSSRTVIIGAGTIGLYLASMLASRGQDVLVIESGDHQLGQFDHDSYKSVGRAHFGIAQGRSRNVGGTSSLWGGQLVEFLPADFKKRKGVTGSGWPIGYDDIAPYYRPTYLKLGIPASVVNDDEVLKSIGTRKPDLGPELEMFLTRWMRTPNFAQLFADQIQSDPKLIVLTGHVAVGFRGTGDAISAVHVTDSNGKQIWIEGETFVLAAGTIENARLLLATAQDNHWQAPWRNNKNIGLYFQDHLGVRLGSFHPLNKKEFFGLFANIVQGKNKFQPKIRIRSEVVEQRQTFNLQGIFAFDSDASEHILFLKQFLRAALYSGKLTGFRDVLRKGTGVVRLLFPLMWKYILDHRVFVPTTAKTTFTLQGEQAPIAESRLTVNNAVKDVNGLPQVVLDWRVNGDELEPIRAFALQAGEALSNAGFGELKIDERLLKLDPGFLNDAGDTYHQAGGTIMGSSVETGVVDTNLRVFSTQNLYVAGASVFCTSSGANVTFTALTFTTRLADHLTGISSLVPKGQTAAR